MITLRPYQIAAENALRQSYRAGHNAPLLVAPTGSGKTVTFASIAYNAGQRNNNTLILVHRKELLRQTSRTLDKFGVTHGLIAPGMSFTTAPVQVASVQTLARRLHLIRWVPDLIVIDEAHHATHGSTWDKCLSRYQGAKLLGVTATPERLDGRGIGVHANGFFDDLIMGPSVRDLIQQGYLSPPEIYAPGAVDMSAVHSRGGDFAKEEMAELMDKPKIIGDAVAHYRKHAHREPALVFCVSVEHAEHTAEHFRQAGYQAASIDGKLDDRSRTQRITDLGNGILNVLTSCEIVSEGTDIPIVSAAILLRPTQSTALYLQQVGRALRPFEGKRRALILDHVGNCLRHGLPDDDRQWSLDSQARKKRESDDDSKFPIRQCEQCYHVHRPAPQCPKCGFVYPIQSREVEQEDGELERIDRDELRRRMKREQGRADSLDALIEIGRQRGYRNPSAWARYVWQARVRKGRVAA